MHNARPGGGHGGHGHSHGGHGGAGDDDDDDEDAHLTWAQKREHLRQQREAMGGEALACLRLPCHVLVCLSLLALLSWAHAAVNLPSRRTHNVW